MSLIKPIAFSCLLVILLLSNSSLSLLNQPFTIPKMVKQTPDNCCLPRKIFLQADIMQVGFVGNETTTFFSTWKITNDLDNGKSRSDVVKSNDGPDLTAISYRDGTFTYSYTIVWGQTCFCYNDSKADWNNNYCTPQDGGKLLEQSNIGFNKASKFGFESISGNNAKRFMNSNYVWTLPIDQKTCLFVNSLEGITNPVGSFSKTMQFYGASYQIDPKAFVIPEICPPPSSCKIVN